LLAEGADLALVCRTLEVSVQTYQRWRVQYKAMRPEDVARLKVLEKENARLKRLLAEKELDVDMLREVARGNFWPRSGDAEPSGICKPASGCPSGGRVAQPISTDHRSVAVVGELLMRRCCGSSCTCSLVVIPATATGACTCCSSARAGAVAASGYNDCGVTRVCTSLAGRAVRHRPMSA
jgi:putative transposase